ncbi:unnamed protein product [Urochloa decumbens]|uniref:Ubiquitin-like protease family profile domain-containing protein n=1 Tax=Urochloa decumbens TaxID=240449 RepID=A0ABC8VF45_9POAL
MVETVCMPAKFSALCRKLTKDQRGIVEKIGLGSLLTIPSMPIQRMLVEKLVENFNVVDRTFTIQGHTLSISPWDVYCILGLQDKGEKIEISRKQADRKWFNLYKQEGDTAITLKYLEERIPKEADGDHFARLFVLYAVGTILAPSSKGYVSSCYLELVVNVSRIKGLNWARFTLEHLLENLALFKSSRRTGLAGNLALFQVWFFEHFQAAGDGLEYAKHQHPLIRNWDEDKVIKRARLQAIKKFGAEKVVIELEPNETKVCTGNDNLRQANGGQYNEGRRHENFENEDWNENVQQEEVNGDNLRYGTKDEETKMKETMESVGLLLKRCPEFHTVVQMLIAGSTMSTNYDWKQCDSSGSSKLRESHSNVQNGSERASPADNKDKSEKAKSCQEPGTAFEREVFSSDLSSSTKRKIHFFSSPTLVQKVKTRIDRQPSKVCKSPYAGIKQKRVSKPKMNSAKQKSVSKTKTNIASVGALTKGLKLNDLELHAISYVCEEMAIHPKKNLVRVGISQLDATSLKCLVAPVEGNTTEKWLHSGIINSYGTMLNSDRKNNNAEMKHAVSDAQCQWICKVGRAWIKSGRPRWRLCLELAQELLGADMVFLPMNTSNTHWWLCVLHPGRNEFQVLNSFNWHIDYEQETFELRCGIHSILQAILNSSEKLASRWNNYDILKWDVVVKDNIPRQYDACSCGIFTIKYMQYWNGRELTNMFSQTDMETIRKRMPAELIMTPLNEITSSKDHVLAM